MCKSNKLLSTFIILAILVTVWKTFLISTESKIQNFDMVDYTYKSTDVYSLSTNDKLILLINSKNKFIEDFVNYFNPTDEYKTIVLSKWGESNYLMRKNLYYSSNTKDIGEIKSKFNLEKDQNYIIHVDKNNYIIKYEQLIPRNKHKIILKYEANTQNKIGDLTPLKRYIEKTIKMKNGGLILYAQKVNKSCTCFRNFETLEKIYLSRGKLNVGVLGDWTEKDIENFMKERKYAINVKKAEDEFSLLVDNWAKDTGRDDFEVIVVNENGFIRYFFLLSNENYKQWYEYANKYIGHNLRLS